MIEEYGFSRHMGHDEGLSNPSMSRNDSGGVGGVSDVTQVHEVLYFSKAAQSLSTTLIPFNQSHQGAKSGKLVQLVAWLDKVPRVRR